jgi:hypothetical protein
MANRLGRRHDCDQSPAEGAVLVRCFDGRLALIGNAEGSITVSDLTAECVTAAVAVDAAVTSVAFSRRYFAAADTRGRIWFGELYIVTSADYVALVDRRAADGNRSSSALFSRSFWRSAYLR